MSSLEREYIVTVKKDVDWQEVHQDIINDTTFDESVNSEVVPDRPVESPKERPTNRRNTHYSLTDEEAAALRQDERILAVQAVEEIPEPEPLAVQDGWFDRTTTSSGRKDNWGLLRHTATNNIYGNSSSDPGVDYNYVLDGTGVDIVIMDTGIQANHPEWDDENGNSRLQQINWFTASGVSGSQPSNFYTDVNGHGTHCAGTMAGKKFGWAKNARIYSMTTYGNTGNSISFEDAVDCLIGWHNNKPIDSSTGVKRPTVVNMSFQYSWYIDTSVEPNKFSLSSTGTSYEITGGRYRGDDHDIAIRTSLQSKGVRGTNRGRYMYGRKIASKDADVEQLIANGIHVCTAAGNNYMKIALPGQSDYNNYLKVKINIFNTDYVYYHRGASPSTFEGGDTYTGSEQDFSYNEVGSIVSPAGSPSFNAGFEVGALDNSSLYRSGSYLDKKVSFSDSGPGVDIYAVGDQVISAGIDGTGYSYYYGSNARQTKKSGTSMAAPQVCGMIACVLQAHPDWSPAQVKEYLINNSQDVMYDTSSDTDYISSSSLHGGNNRIAYLPMNGDKTFTYSS